MEEQADRHRHLREETINSYQFKSNLSQVKLLLLAQVPPPSPVPPTRHHLLLLNQLLNQLRHQLYCQHHKMDQSTTTRGPTAQAPR